MKTATVPTTGPQPPGAAENAPGDRVSRQTSHPVKPPAPAPSRTALLLAFAAIYVIWGSTYLGMRVAIETMPPFMMASARFLLAGGLLFLVLKVRGAPWPTLRQWRANAIIGTFLLLGGNG